MNNKYVLALVFLVLSTFSSVFGQVGIFKDQANFEVDVNALMAIPKTEAATNAGSGLVSVYGSSSNVIKAKIFDITQKLYQKKKFKAPQFIDFYTALYSAVAKKNMAATDMDSLLYVTQKMVDKYDSKQILSFFTTIRTLFEKDALYASSFNNLLISGGSYKFRFIEAAPVQEMDINEMMKEEEEREKEQFEDFDKMTIEEDTWGSPDETTQDDQAQETPADENVLDVGYNAPLQPAIEGAVIVFDNIDLSFQTPYETAVLKGTSGAVRLQDNIFVGKGGKIDWSTVGMGDQLVAELKEFNFPIIATRLYSEGAILTYPEKIEKPVTGIFEYKSIRHKSANDATFPRFKSFSSDVEMKGLGENIEYYGGISLAGKNIYSSSVDEGSSTIKIKNGEKVVIKAKAPRFELGDSLITTGLANLVIYINDGKDSIIHPGVSIKYNKSNPRIRAVKPSSYKGAPFLDSYHKMDITVDGMVWDLSKSEIDFSIFQGKNEIRALFQSESFYEADKYSSMQGIYRFHPLQMLIGYADRHKQETEYNVQDIAKETKIDLASVRGSMNQLMKLGYIEFNSRTGVVKLRPRARHNVLSRRDKSDYDNILLYSLTPSASNATLDLASNELIVRGVDKVYLSDSLRVFILPDSNTVRIRQNRDFNFNGKINTENFQFVGTKFEFKYDSFLVHLRDIQEIKVAVTEKKDKSSGNEGKSRVLGNELKYSSGTLYINKPDNKSSRKKFAEYPIFDARTGATVFFDKNHINGGAYDTTIQFKIPPFRIDSLSADDRNAIGFDGEFKSGGIFPPFKEKLVVMPDYSLGFNHAVPADGYPLYGKKGKFYNKVTLDNQGIRGDGEIHYLSTTAWSKDFIFYKDSVVTIGTKAVTKEGTHPETVSPTVTFADLNINEYAMKWQPYNDSMAISNIKELLSLYKNTATLDGKAIITPEGMNGSGSLFTRGSQTSSDNFHFEQTKFSGRNSTFQILTENPDKPAVLCNDVKIDFNLEDKKAIFSPEVEGVASNTFPYLQYKSSLDKGVWDLEKKEILMKMEEGGDLSKSFFYSTHPNQDSLVFNATQGLYDMNSQTLKIDGVPFIKVADGKIFPDSNKVVVHENAVIETMKKAKIVIDTINEYHHLYDGTISIVGRKKFEGEATYQYVNLGADTLSFKFQDFRLQESMKKNGRASTVATGVVKEEDSLWIDNGVLYKGKVTMYADNKILFFEGYVQLVLKGALHYTQWMKYLNNGDKSEVEIDVTNPMADNGTPLFSGIHYCENDSLKLYPTFLSQKKAPSDIDIITAKGILIRNRETGLYTIAQKDKSEKKVMAGNVFSYLDDSSTVQYSGKFNFTTADKNFEAVFAGEGNGLIKSNIYHFNTLANFSCKPAAAAFTAIGQNLKLVSSVMPPDTMMPTEADYVKWNKKNELMPYRVAEIAGDKSAMDYKTKSSTGYVALPALSGEFAKSIVLSDVEFEWNPVFNAWYSVGKVKVSNFLKEDINKQMNGYVEIRKTVKGDVINIYLEPTYNNWYYITYSENKLSIITSNDEVNTIAGKKAAKVEPPTREKFYYMIGSPMEKEQFKSYFEENYLGKKHETVFEQHEQETIDVPDTELEKSNEETTEPSDSNEEKKEPYPHEEKLKYEKKEGHVIEEPELNREKKEQSVEEKKQLQQDQEKLKNLFK